uniref:Uncharacterized protein n=1 Tax=Glossina brevipalpis TaxID=37001 RepID=A0A1A9WNR5_9MUSC
MMTTVIMGRCGVGGLVPVDNVRLPSWQAQLTGSKRWLLAPPPECYFHCSTIEALVEKGDINYDNHDDHNDDDDYAKASCILSLVSK